MSLQVTVFNNAV